LCSSASLREFAVSARPVEQKKGADHGIDGKIRFFDDPRVTKPEQIIKQGHQKDLGL
jgi:hypothetical protein